MSSQFNDSEDDVTLHTRRSAASDYAAQRHAANLEEDRPPEREVTLNTGIVLALFFALALLCAVFFGFGYSMGRKSVPPPIAGDTDSSNTTTAENSTPTGAAKPSPVQPGTSTVPEYVPPTGTERSTVTVTKPLPPPSATTEEAKVPAASTAPRPAAPVVRVAPSPTPTSPAVAAAPVAGSGTTYVQIAAVSHQEDADVLLSALRRRGYAVLTRSEPADKLIHVQIGPYGTRKEAEVMRQKLAGDGYNAFIK